jgi:hypothetical protein
LASSSTHLGVDLNSIMCWPSTFLPNGHRSLDFCNDRYQNDWRLLSIIGFQLLFRQSSMTRRKIHTHFNGLGSSLVLYIHPLIQKGQIISLLFSQSLTSRKYLLERQNLFQFHVYSLSEFSDHWWLWLLKIGDKMNKLLDFWK